MFYIYDFIVLFLYYFIKYTKIQWYKSYDIKQKLKMHNIILNNDDS